MMKEVRGAKALQLERLPARDQRGKITVKKSDIWQFLRFCIVGSLNAVIDFLVLNLFLWAYPSQDTWRVLCYNSLAVLLAATNSFFCNKYWTFQQRHSIALREVYRFVVVAGGTILMNDLLMWQLSRLFPNLLRNSLVGTNALKLAAIIGTMSISFFGMRLWVFFQSTVAIGIRSPERTVHEISIDRAPLATSNTLSPARSEERKPLKTIISSPTFNEFENANNLLAPALETALTNNTSASSSINSKAQTQQASISSANQIHSDGWSITRKPRRIRLLHIP